jgi:hypothetical protein
MVVQTDSTLGIGKASEYEKNIVEVTRDRKKVGGVILERAVIFFAISESTTLSCGV